MPKAPNPLTGAAYGTVPKSEMINFIKKAHEACRKEVAVSRHDVGGTLGGSRRRVIRRSRADYLECIRRKVQEQVDNFLKSKGVPVKA